MSWWFGNFAKAYHLLNEHENELEVANDAQDYFPNDLNRHAAKAAAFAALGKVDEIREIVDWSKTITEPQDGTAGWVMLTATMELHTHGHKEASLEFAEEAVNWYREQEKEYRSSLVSALMHTEQWKEAYTLLEELIAEDPEIKYLGQKGVVAAWLDDEAEARRMEEKLAAIEQDYLMGAHTYQRARIKAVLGEQEEALALIKESFEQGKLFSISFHRDIAFELLHDYPPFQEILEPVE